MKLYKRFPLYVLPLLCLPWAVGALYAVEGDSYTLLDDLNLRQGPGSSYVSNRVVTQGTRVIELTREGEWTKVRLTSSDAEGWVYGGSLALEPPMTASTHPVDVVPVASVQLPLDDQKINDQQGMQQVVETPEETPEKKHALPTQSDAVQVNLDVAALAPVEESAALISDAEPVAAIVETEATLQQKETPLADPDQMDQLTVLEESQPVEAEAVVQVSSVVMNQTAVDGANEAAVQSDDSVAIHEPETLTATVDIADSASQTVSADQTARDEPVIVAKAKPVEAETIEQTSLASMDQTAVDIAAETVNESEPVAAIDNDAALLAQTADSGSPWFGFNDNANLRAGPNARFDVVAWATTETKARELDRQGEWVRIQLQSNKRIGWVSDSLLVPLNKAEPISSEMLRVEPAVALNAEVKNIASLATKPQSVVPKATAVVETNTEPSDGVADSQQQILQTVMIRAQASSLSEMLGWLGSGALVDIVEQQGKWTKVRMQKSGRMGWVESTALKQPDAVESFEARPLLRTESVRLESVIEEPIRKQAAAEGTAREEAVSAMSAASVQEQAAPAVSASSVQEQVASVAVHEQIALAVSAAAVHEQTALAVSAAAVQEHAIVALQGDTHLYRFNRKSNLRAGPDLKHDVVAWAGNGSQAHLLNRQGDWMRVQMQVNKRIGWVFHNSLNYVKGTVQQAAQPVAQAALKVASSTVIIAPDVVERLDDKPTHQIYLFKRTSDMRSGPGKGYARTGWGGRNESAEEIGSQGNWKHVRMTISGKEGWVFNAYLEQSADTGSYDIVKSASVSTEALQTGLVYQVMRTEPLRSTADEFAELIGSVSKGDMVTWLDEKNGWVKVNPQLADGKQGWIQAKLLKEGDLRAVVHKKAIMNKANTVAYRDRISKGNTFNYSYAALDEALYRVPVEDIHIRMDKDDLKALFLKRQYDKSSFDVSIKTGRHKLRGTVKVLGSSTRIFKKKSLLLKLDKESARWYGHRRVALRSMASDKALMREWMAWKMMAALGMKVPEVHFTRLSFNRGEKTGLYLSIEWMGSEFLEANGLDVRGEFYQPIDAAFCGDLYSTDNLPACFSKITPQDDDYGHLERMARAINAASNDDIDKVMDRYFDVESVINWMTMNALLTNGDTYNKNYWLYYHPSKRKWTLVPWDYNLIFGRTYDQYGSKGFRIFNDNFQYYYPPDVGAGNPLKDKALRNPKLRALMESKIKHLIGMEPNGSEQTFGWFSPTVMHARIGNLATVVGKELYKDTFLSYGEEDFTKNYESLMHYVTAHDYFLKTKLFGDFKWNPEPPNQGFVNIPLPDQLFGFGELEAGKESLHLIDRGWGYFVAHLDLNTALQSKAEFEVRVEGGITPKYLPTGQSPRRCIERSWQLRIKTANVSTTANVMFEYMQENSRRSEVPPSIHEELLELWMLDNNHWQPVQTTVNEYSNTLLAKGIHIESGHSYRFVACSPF